MIPKKAKRVYKGYRYEVYEWRQRLYDGSFQTFEGIKQRNSTHVIPVYKGKIIISREMQPQWEKERVGFLGGLTEPGEKPLQGAKRELLEEAGLKSDDWELLSVFPNYTFNSYYYIARNCRKVAEQHLDPGEKIKLIPLDFNKFVKLTKKKNWRIIDLLYDRKLNTSNANELSRRIFGR